MSDDERAIRDLVTAWMAASKAGDVQAILAMITDDAVFLVPGQPQFGKQAFASRVAGMAGMTVDGTSKIEEVEVLDEWAYMRSHIDVTVTLSGSKPVTRSGHTLTILRKAADGCWRIARDANLLTTTS